MSEVKHTPGPWTWGDQFNGLYSPNGEVMDFDRYDGMWLSFENQKANAALISAAPEMLEELDVRVGDLVMLRKAIEAGDPKAELLIRVDDMLRETRAAIAKAEGRS